MNREDGSAAITKPPPKPGETQSRVQDPSIGKSKTFFFDAVYDKE